MRTLNAQSGLPEGYKDYSGIFHVHTFHSHHSTGTFEDAARAAQKANADFVIITDHDSLNGLRDKKEGFYGPVLVLIGTELSTPAGHLGVVGVDKEVNIKQSTSAILREVEKTGAASFICHAQLKLNPWTDWTVTQMVTGMEVFNLPATIYDDGFFKASLKSLFLFPDSFMNSFLNRPDALLQQWDQILTKKRFVGIASGDAHERYRICGWALDSYEAMFEVVQTHVLAADLSKQAIFSAFKKGHVYIGFDIVEPVRNFLFSAETEKGLVMMGDIVKAGNDLRLRVTLPEHADIHVMKDGQLWKTASGNSWEAPAEGVGVYRVEVYFKNKLWILSNPIYVR